MVPNAATPFQFDMALHDELRTSTEQAIEYAIEHRQELLDKALSETQSIRYSKLVFGLGPWTPFYLIGDDRKENEVTLSDSPKRFKKGDYSAYYLDRAGNLLLIRNWLQHEMEDGYWILFEKEGVNYAVLFYQDEFLDNLGTYRFVIKDGHPHDSALITKLVLWGEHIDWNVENGNGSFLCSAFDYPIPNPKRGGQPGFGMRRVRFLIENDQQVGYETIDRFSFTPMPTP